MPIYKAKLSDGRTVRFESETEPTHDEILAAVESETSRKREEFAREKEKLELQRGQMDTLERDIGFLERALEPISASGLLNQFARAQRTITGEQFADPFRPGEPAIAEVPEPEGTGVLAGLGKVGARIVNMLQTPESLVSAGAAPASAPMRTIFAGDIARHIPEQVAESAQVLGDIESTPAEKTAAWLMPPLSAGLSAAIARSPRTRGLLETSPSTAAEIARMLEREIEETDLTRRPGIRLPDRSFEPLSPEPPARPTTAAVAPEEPAPTPAAAAAEAARPEPPPEVPAGAAPSTSTAAAPEAAAAAPLEVVPGPGAASPLEFAQRLRERPPSESNLPVAIDATTKPDVQVVRRNKDYHLFNAFNSGQWAFGFGQLGEAAKAAWERMALGEFKMRESIKRDTETYVRDLLDSVPREMRKDGGKAFFEVIDGRRMDDIVQEWEGKPGGERVIAAAEKLKTRLEEIRTTIRDTKRDSYRAYLQGLNRDPLETMFRNTISDKVDTAAMTKEQFSDALALAEFPDDWGIADGSYLPHLFFGNWKIEALLPGEQQPSFVTRAKTAAEAKARIFEISRNNPAYANAKWTIGQDTVIPADMIRLGDRKFWNMISRMKEQTAGEVNVKDAVQGIVGRKASKQKWFGSLQKREGFANYSKDFEQVMSAYLNGFHRWKELSAMQRDVQPLIETVRSEGRINAAQRLDDIMENLWGKPTQTTILFDAFLRQIPGMRDFIKPLALDRWSRNVRSIVSLLALSTPRFALVNRLQPLQGLYPIVGERLLVKGKAMQHTAEGKALLDEAGVSFDPGQYADTRGGLSKVRDFLEQVRGERTNQSWAFLSMYLHGIEQGMSKPQAINYAKLRGQLMTQFTPLISDTPPILHGPLMSAMFQFKRFPIKQAELIADMVRNGQIGGITRMLAVFALVGGASVFLRQAWTDKSKRLALQRKLAAELGEDGADALMYGLPGLLNADLSGSLVLADEPLGDDVYARAGRTLAGPAPSFAIDIGRTVTAEQREPMTPKEKAVVVMRRIPALRPIAELLSFNDDEILAPDGETKYRRRVADALASIGSFRSAHESNQRLAVDAIVELKKEEISLKNAYYVAKAGGTDTAKALADIDAFNKRWPEVKITRGDLSEYMEYRRRNAKKTDIQRMAGKKYKKLVVP